MAKPKRNVPPRGGARRDSPARRPGTARARPTRRSGGTRRRRYLYASTAVVVAAVVAVIVALTATSGSSGVNKHSAAIGYTRANGTKVYGKLGPENVPLEVGPALASPNAGLTGAPIDGIQCNTNEQLVYHHHVHIAIFVDGKPYSIPPGVGMVPPVQVTNTSRGSFADGSGTCLYWVHVHAQDGIVHIESPETRNFELGQFFDIWHVPLGADGIGSHKGHVTATVNGVPWTGRPQQIPLQEDDQIVLNVGGPVVAPPPISWSGTGL